MKKAAACTADGCGHSALIDANKNHPAQVLDALFGIDETAGSGNMSVAKVVAAHNTCTMREERVILANFREAKITEGGSAATLQPGSDVMPTFR